MATFTKEQTNIASELIAKHGVKKALTIALRAGISFYGISSRTGDAYSKKMAQNWDAIARIIEKVA
jgi:hypothetical protein